MTWIQRPARTSLGPSPSGEFHGCLDALIVTIRELRTAEDRTEWSNPSRLDAVIAAAEERAAICAGLLFDRWIEETDAVVPSLDELMGPPLNFASVTARAIAAARVITVPKACQACRDVAALGLTPVHNLKEPSEDERLARIAWSKAAARAPADAVIPPFPDVHALPAQPACDCPQTYGYHHLSCAKRREE